MGSTSRFRFRDQGIGDSTGSGSSLESSSGSGHADDDSDLQSMTAKGIKRLCSELLELKEASDDDFYKSVYSNYSEFVRIFEEAEVMENELMELKKYLLTQRRLLRESISDIYLEALSEESTESIIEEDSYSELRTLSKLETHTGAITETLDILLSEHRLDEVLNILEMEPTALQTIQSQEDFSPPILTSYNSAIAERRRMLADQLAVVAEHPRTTAPELQKALSGLCRLGDCQRANVLLIQFYRSRLAHGMLDLQHSKPYLHEIYIRELAKFVFSVISQATTSVISLYGERSPYTSELIQWAREETEKFVCCFDRYVKSISETTGGLHLTVESLKQAISFCSSLDSQRILLRPYLILLIRPCMEGVLDIHIHHFKKVMHIFTATDAWVLSKFLTCELLRDRPSYLLTDGKAESCLLTNSGRKFITLIQGIVDDVSPLVTLQMGSSILKGFADMFNEYVDILKRSIPSKANVGGLRTNLAKTLHQQLSLLANSCTLVIFFSSFSASIFKGVKCSEDETSKEDAEHYQQQDLDKWIFSVQEAGDRLRSYFCQQFVLRVMTPRQELSPETYLHGQNEYSSLQDPMPSAVFQVLFLQLRQLEKLAEDVFVGMEWPVAELLRQLMEAVLVWLLNNQEFWTGTGERAIVQQSSNFNQFLLDMQFLLEIARFGGYFTDKLMDASIALIDRMETAFIEAGLDPNGDILDDGWAAKVAKAVIDKLLEIEKKNSPLAEGSIGTCEEHSENEECRDANESVEDASSPLDDSIDVEGGQAAHAAESTIRKLEDMEKAEATPLGEEISQSSSNNTLDMEDLHAENAANKAISNLLEAEEIEARNLEGSVSAPVDNYDKIEKEMGTSAKESAAYSKEPVGLSDEQLESESFSVIEEIHNIPEPESPTLEGTELFLEEDFDMQLIGDSNFHVKEADRRRSLYLRDDRVSNVVTNELTESNTTELPDMEGYEFVLVKVVDQQGEGDVKNYIEEETMLKYYLEESGDGR